MLESVHVVHVSFSSTDYPTGAKDLPMGCIDFRGAWFCIGPRYKGTIHAHRLRPRLLFRGVLFATQFALQNGGNKAAFV